MFDFFHKFSCSRRRSMTLVGAESAHSRSRPLMYRVCLCTGRKFLSLRMKLKNKSNVKSLFLSQLDNRIFSPDSIFYFPLFSFFCFTSCWSFFILFTVQMYKLNFNIPVMTTHFSLQHVFNNFFLASSFMPDLSIQTSLTALWWHDRQLLWQIYELMSHLWHWLMMFIFNWVTWSSAVCQLLPFSGGRFIFVNQKCMWMELIMWPYMAVWGHQLCVTPHTYWWKDVTGTD